MPIAMMAALLCAAANPAAPPAETPAPAVQAKAAPAEAAPAKKKRKGKPAVEGVLNVNRASEAELRLLDGIGKKRAELIVARREKQPFKSLDELSRMKGMKGIVRRQHAHLSVQGDSTLHPAKP